MAVSLLGSGSAIGILLSALLFSILKIGGLGMQTGAGIPFEIVNVSIALIIFFVGINFLIRFIMAKFFQGKNKKRSWRLLNRNQQIRVKKEENYNVNN